MNPRTKIAITISLLLITVLIGGYFVFRHVGARRSIYRAPAENNKTLSDFYQQAQSLRGNMPAQDTAEFLAVGDIMLSRNVAAGIHGDYNVPFEKMSGILSATNFNFANLESPFDPASKGIIGGHSLVFGAPAQLIAGLTYNNFQILNLANNHAMDQGLAGLDFTRSLLDQNHILHEGTGDSLEQAWQPAAVAAGGMKICFVGASYAST
ncbi:MAG: CapA family protein, partial [Patescibacteria group bacterium]|nr:CapA family protein [Patescibacteria group bacterium]